MEKKAAIVDEYATRLKTITSGYSLPNSCCGLFVNDLLIGLFCLFFLDVFHRSLFERFRF